MGECGCGDFNGDFKFKGPDGITYVLQVYPGCDYCDAPAGIVLYAMNKEDCATWGVAEIQEVKIQDVGTFFSVIHPKNLVKSVLRGIEDYIEDGLDGEFRSAVFDSIKDNKRIHEDAQKDTHL